MTAGLGATKQPNKLRFNQPRGSKKNVNFISTEIRCQEKARGGLRYEVIMAEPNLVKSQAPGAEKKKAPVVKPQLSVNDIEEKLKAAEQRRLNHEAQKVASWNAKLMKIEEASRKKNELNQEFICHAKDSLVSKMEHTEEKRDAIISDKLEKIKVHTDEIKRNKVLMEQQRARELEQLNERLETAANLRDENIKRVLERLRKHELRAMMVRQNKAAIVERQSEVAVEA